MERSIDTNGGLHVRQHQQYQHLKRAVDVVLATGLLVLVSPMMAGLIALVRRRIGRPATVGEPRLGYEAQPFLAYRLRTLTFAHRPTRFGRWLERSGLAQLPQLWNVLRGEMSLVGPRPLLPEHVAHYSPEQVRRHEVAPGITGWAEVNAGREASFDERLSRDLWYVEHQGPGLDLLIFGLGTLKVLSGIILPAGWQSTIHPLA